MARIREEEYADNLDNKTTIPVDLEWYFPEEDVIVEWKESKTEILKKELYNKLWLSEILEENSDMQKFEKWLLDWWLLDNLEMLEDLANSSIEEIIQIIKQLSNWETIKAILIDLYESLEDITKIFTEPYAGWVALWALWIWPISKSLKWLKVVKEIEEKLSMPLYEDNKYKYLEEYKDILWEDMKIWDIVWEWNNAVVLEYKKNPDFVVKVRKKTNLSADSIEKEFDNHILFFNAYQKLWWEKTFWNVKIPEVKTLDKKWIFLIEKIEWETIYSKSARDILEKKGIILEKWLKDKDIDHIVNNQNILIQEDINHKAFKDFGYELWLELGFFDTVLWVDNYLRKDIDNPILNILREIKKETWYIHNDFHPWNLMKWKNGTYIIDFGRIR